LLRVEESVAGVLDRDGTGIGARSAAGVKVVLLP
jgi:hypothetical protein